MLFLHPFTLSSFYAFLVLHFFNKIFFFYILKKMSNESNQNVSNENLNPNNPSNNPPNNPNKKKRRGGSQKKSWVWEWFEADETGATCQVEDITGGQCGKHYKNASSTGNLIVHLNNKHQITEGLKKQDFVVIKIIIYFIYFKLFN